MEIVDRWCHLPKVSDFRLKPFSISKLDWTQTTASVLITVPIDDIGYQKNTILSTATVQDFWLGWPSLCLPQGPQHHRGGSFDAKSDSINFSSFRTTDADWNQKETLYSLRWISSTLPSTNNSSREKKRMRRSKLHVIHSLFSKLDFTNFWNFTTLVPPLRVPGWPIPHQSGVFWRDLVEHVSKTYSLAMLRHLWTKLWLCEVSQFSPNLELAESRFEKST